MTKEFYFLCPILNYFTVVVHEGLVSLIRLCFVSRRYYYDTGIEEYYIQVDSYMILRRRNATSFVTSIMQV
jgi:hypothetical protein